jgi:hypothetical protein
LAKIIALGETCADVSHKETECAEFIETKGCVHVYARGSEPKSAIKGELAVYGAARGLSVKNPICRLNHKRF